MIDQTTRDGIAFLVVMIGGGLFVAATAVIGVRVLEWVEARFSKGGRDMLDAEVQPHPYHDDIRLQQEAAHAEWLDMARDAITKLSLSRHDGIVSSDDVWDICPPPPGVEPRTMGAIWQPRDRWQKAGYVQSRRHLVNHKRPIMQWRYLRVEDMRMQEAAE